MSADPIELLESVAAFLIDVSSAEHVEAGRRIQAFLDGDHETLDSAFGLSATGSRSPATKAALHRRDQHLRNAHQLLPDIGTLARRLATYHERYWPADRSADTCPQRWTGRLEEHLWAALRHHPHPVSHRRLREILHHEEPAARNPSKG